MDIKNKEEEETKETFCPVCLAVPLAFAGAGVTSVGANQSSVYKRRKTILLYGGIVVGVISLMIIVYYKFIRDCDSCK